MCKGAPLASWSESGRIVPQKSSLHLSTDY
ncbi:unnamed protein product [Linum tenue]|uniref:Uncharacterized protein n=1 Tax=Linum tenue TaxID=586396 RepID=A0AAV0MLJ3_9ROSI|nr:unnamed protein product [Linum tenue]